MSVLSCASAISVCGALYTPFREGRTLRVGWPQGVQLSGIELVVMMTTLRFSGSGRVTAIEYI